LFFTVQKTGWLQVCFFASIVAHHQSLSVHIAFMSTNTTFTTTAKATFALHHPPSSADLV